MEAVKLLVLIDSLSTLEMADLKRVCDFNPIRIKRIDATEITSYKEVVDLASDCDIIVAILPRDILVDLVDPSNNGKAVIQPIRSSDEEEDLSSDGLLTTEQLGTTSWEQVLLTATLKKS